VSTAAATWAASSAAAATTTLGGLVDADRSSIQLGSMQFALSLGRIIGISKGYESKTSGTPSLTVGDDFGVGYLSEGLEVGLKGGVISGPG